MLNHVVLVGRLTKDPEIIETETGKKRTRIIIAVGRGFKNMEGLYETDFIPCILWNSVAENTCEYCKKGDMVGIKGRIQTNKIKSENSVKTYIEVIAEKVTFLMSPRETQQEN